MGRLIDAEVLIEQLREADRKCSNDIIKACIGLVQTQYTAYDVEKVVEGLEEVKEAVSGCFGTMCSECKYTKKCYTGELSYKVAIDNAISIVKRGGVE